MLNTLIYIIISIAMLLFVIYLAKKTNLHRLILVLLFGFLIGGHLGIAEGNNMSFYYLEIAESDLIKLFAFIMIMLHIYCGMKYIRDEP